MGAGAPVSSAPTAGWHVEGARIDSGFKPTQDRSWGNIATALEQHSVANVEMEDARGWPLPAFWCSFDVAGIDSSTSQRPVTGGIALSARGTHTEAFRALPFTPIWRGIAIDSAVFTFACAAALAIVFIPRRALRVWRRRCPRCAYALSGSTTGICPECGRRPRALESRETAH